MLSEVNIFDRNFCFFLTDLGDLLWREGSVGAFGQGSRFWRVCRPAHVERRVRGGASAGRPQQQQQQQQQQDGAGEIEIDNIFIAAI